MAQTPANRAPDAEGAGELVEVDFQGMPLKIRASLDPSAMQRRILERLFEAKSLDEAFEVWESQSSDGLEGRVFIMTSVSWGVYTRQEDGTRIPLAEVHHVDAEGEELRPWVTTASNLVGFLAAAEQGEWFPFTARIVGERTSSGRTALRFARP